MSGSHQQAALRGDREENLFTQEQSGCTDVGEAKKANADGRTGAPQMEKLLSQSNNKVISFNLLQSTLHI